MKLAITLYSLALVATVSLPVDGAAAQDLALPVDLSTR